jgi:hypothetical protein
MEAVLFLQNITKFLPDYNVTSIKTFYVHRQIHGSTYNSEYYDYGSQGYGTVPLGQSHACRSQSQCIVN